MAALEGSSHRVIAAELGLLAVVYPSPRRSEAEWELVFDVYSGDLAHVPPDILAEACAVYRRDGANRFFPTPGAILDLCSEKLARRRGQVKALEHVVWAVDEMGWAASAFQHGDKVSGVA